MPARRWDRRNARHGFSNALLHILEGVEADEKVQPGELSRSGCFSSAVS
jgi:hypothetical protein